MVAIAYTFFTVSSAQNHYDRLVHPDLVQQYSEARSASKRALILYDFALYYQVKNYQVDSVLYYADELLALAKNEQYPPAEVLGERMLGSQYSRINEFARGRKHLLRSLEVAVANDYLLHIHDSYSPLAYGYMQEGVLDSALFYYHKCLDIAPADLHSKRSTFHNGLANVYSLLGRDDMREWHLLQCYDEAQQADIRLDQIIALTYLLDFYTLTERNAAIFNKYKRPYDSLCSYYPSMSSNLHSHAMFFDSIPEDQRIDFLQEALMDNKRSQYIEGVYLNFLQLQREYLDRSDYQSALHISNDALSYHEEGHAVRLDILIEIYKNKIDSEKLLGDSDRALETTLQYQYLKDSLITVTNAKDVNELSIKYETARKDQELAQSSSELLHRTAQRNYVLLGSGLLLVAGFYLWRRTRYKQMQIETENKLQTERIANLEKEKQILSLTSMLAGQEAERTRIAQDLHDGLGGLLSSVRNHFSMINQELLKIDSLKIYDRTNTMIDQACTEVRRISHNLMPASLQLNGLIPTLKQYCDDVEASHPIAVQFEYMGPRDARLQETIEVFVYRIAQECISNVLKHAKADNLLVQIVHSVREVTLVIEDDGVGFDTACDYEGIGLHSIRSRVSHLRGELDIDSRIGEGTTITINISYEHN